MVRRVQIHEIINWLLCMLFMVYSIHDVSIFCKFKNYIEKIIMRHVFLANDNRKSCYNSSQENCIIMRCSLPRIHINTQWTFLAFLITCQRRHGFAVGFNCFCCIFELLRTYLKYWIICMYLYYKIVQTNCVWTHPIHYVHYTNATMQ